MRRVLIAIVLASTACTTTNVPSTATSILHPVSTTTAATPTTTASIAPTTEGEAWTLLQADPLGMTPDQIRRSGELIGGHRPGLPFPTILANGDADQRRAVFDVLAIPDPWNVQILAGIALGRPTQSAYPEAEWPTALQTEIEAARDAVADRVFAEKADLALALMHTLVTGWDDMGYDRPSSSIWYDLPEVLAALEGEFSATAFDGQAVIHSDTGEAHTVSVRARGRDGIWSVVDGDWIHIVGLGPVYGSIDRGDVLDPTNLPPLVNGGFAVDAAGDLVLVQFDGNVIGHLEGFSLQSDFYAGGLVPLLVAPSGTKFTISPDGLSEWDTDGLPTRSGLSIGRSTEGITVRRDTTLTWGPIEGQAWVDYTGTVVTVEPNATESGQDQSVAFDATSDSEVLIDPYCWVAHAGSADWLLSCAPPYPKTADLVRLSGDVLVDGEAWGPLFEAAGTPWPLPEGHGINGRWTAARPNPTEETWILSWSGECESTDAFLVSEGKLSHVTGLDIDTAPSARALGWLPDGRVLVSLAGFNYGCNKPAEQPGVHAVSLDGTLELLWDSGGRDVAAVAWQPDPDGTRQVFGKIAEVDANGGIRVDLAEFLGGEVARRAAVADGEIEEGEDLPNNFYIRSLGRVLDVAADETTTFRLQGFDATGSPLLVDVDWATFTAHVNGAEILFEGYGGEYFELLVRDDRVISIDQVYLP